jgi:hypothetical protein
MVSAEDCNWLGPTASTIAINDLLDERVAEELSRPRSVDTPPAPPLSLNAR